MYRFEQKIGERTIIHEGKEIWDALKQAFPGRKPFENIYLNYIKVDLPCGMRIGEGDHPQCMVFEFKRVQGDRYYDHYVYHGLIY